MGVEEEFLLLERDGGVAPRASAVVRRVGLHEQVKQKLMACQVATTTGPVTKLAELRRELRRLRMAAADAAARRLGLA